MLLIILLMFLIIDFNIFTIIFLFLTSPIPFGQNIIDCYAMKLIQPLGKLIYTNR